MGYRLGFRETEAARRRRSQGRSDSFEATDRLYVARFRDPKRYFSAV